MQDQLLVTEEPTMHDSMLYDKLREMGIEHIEELASAVWNEYNASDPGVTILEVLCYAIADLSYRTSFEMKDIMATYKGPHATDKDLYLPNQILPNSPFTVRDLRKLLLDKPKFEPQVGASLLEFRNAWPVVAKTAEQKLYFDNDEKKLTLFELGEIDGSRSGNDTQLITLNGLYQIQLEFEPDPTQTEGYLKDLNYNFFEHCFTYGANTYCCSILMPYWDDISTDFQNIDFTTSTLALQSTTRQHILAVDKVRFDEYFYDYFAEFNITDVNSVVHPVALNIHLLDFLKTTVDIGGTIYNVQIQFIDWHEVANRIDWDYFNAVDPNHIIQLVTPSPVGAANYPIDVSAGATDLVLDVALEFTMKPTASGNTETMMARVTFLDEVLIPTLKLNLPAVKAAIMDGFATGAAPSLGPFMTEYIGYEAAMEASVKDLNSAFWSNFQEKLDFVNERVYGSLGAEHINVHSYLNECRNICEDFVSYTTARVQEIAVFGNIVVQPGHNPNKIIAEIYFLIDQFLSPIVTFRTLQNLKAAGYKYGDAFNGPTLMHGFLLNEELEALNRRDTLFTSDLVNFIMDVEGVIAIEGLNLSAYIDNRLMACNVVNCLSLTNSEVYRPKLSRPKSDLTVTVEGLVFELEAPVITDWFDSSVREKIEAQVPSSNSYNLSIPLGDDMEIEKYFSIQNDLPEVYGIGPYGLPVNATNERQGQAKQLKGYLMFFDQLLANYLSQVSNLRDLFSVDRTVDSTYAINPVYDVPGISPLFKQFNESGQTWEVFKADLNNAYILTLDGAVEDEVTFLDRRNKFLCHLIGRFSEGFHEYSQAMYHRIQDQLNTVGSSAVDIQTALANYEVDRRAVAAQIIEDKICYLEDYPAISNERAKALNYLEDPFWGLYETNNPTTTPLNVSGYKKRLCRSLGIKDYSHHNIFGPLTFTGEEGMHIVEHILLRPLDPIDTLLAINSTTFYESEKDPYSFRLTIVLPNFVGRFVDETYRIFVERLIRTETPAHIALDIFWMDQECGIDFELKFRLWLEAHAVQQWPSFDASYLTTKQDLVEAISIPCGQEIDLLIIGCDDNSVAFIPDGSNRITYYYRATDIYTLKFLPPCGTAKIYELVGGVEVELEIINQVGYEHDILDGFAEHYNGVGNYLVRYCYGDSIHELFIDVLLVTDVIAIDVYNGSQLLAPNSDAEPCLEIHACDLPNNHVEFTPHGGTVLLYEAQSNVLETIDPGSTYDLSNMYNQYGAGTYTFEYNYLGQTVTTCIELTGPFITVEETAVGPLTPNGDGVYDLTGTGTEIDVTFDPTGGTWIREIHNGIEFVFDGTGTSAADHLSLTEDAQYRYTYTVCGIELQTWICYGLETDTVQLQVYQGNVQFPPNNGLGYLFDPFANTGFNLAFIPSGGYSEMTFSRNGSSYTTYGNTQNNSQAPIDLMGMWQDHGPGIYNWNYSVNPTDQIEVTLVDPMIRIFGATGVEQVRTDNAGQGEIHFWVGDRNQYPTYVGPTSSIIEFDGIPMESFFNFRPSDHLPGTYELTAEHPLYSISDEVHIVITEDPLGPDSSFDCILIDKPETDVCSFSFNATEQNADSYKWALDGKLVGKASSYDALLTFSDNKESYIVILQVTINGVKTNTRKVVYCTDGAAPFAEFTTTQLNSDQDDCHILLEANDVDGETYEWLLDDVVIGTEKTLSHSFDFVATNPQSVTLNVTKSGMTISKAQNVAYVDGAGITGGYTATEVLNKAGISTFEFTADELNMDAYLWKIDGQEYADRVEFETALDYTAPAQTYAIELTVTKGDISATAAQTIVSTLEDSALRADFSVTQTAEQEDGTVTFDFAALFTGAEAFEWKIDGEVRSFEPTLNVDLVYSSIKTTYFVELTTRKDGLKASEQKNVEGVYTPAPPSSVFGSFEIENDNNGTCIFNFTPEYQGAETYTWVIDGVEYSTEQSLFNVELALSTGEDAVAVELTVTENGQTSTTEVQVSCAPDEADATFQAIKLGSTTEGICKFDFKATYAGAGTYEWLIDDELVGTGEHVLGYSLDFSSTLAYQVQLSVTIGGVTDTISEFITCAPGEGDSSAFTVEHLQTTEEGICSYDFKASNEELENYEWFVNGKLVGTAVHVLAHELDFTEEDSYCVELRVIQDDTEFFSQIEVSCTLGITPDPAFTWEMLTFSESGLCTIEFTAVTQDADDYVWLVDGTETVTKIPTISLPLDFSSVTEYTVQLTVIDGLLSDTSAQVVECNPPIGAPNAAFTVTEISNDDAATCVYDFNATDATNDTYQWFIDDVEIATTADVSNHTVVFDAPPVAKTVVLIVAKNSVEASSADTLDCEVTPAAHDSTFEVTDTGGGGGSLCSFLLEANTTSHDQYDWYINGALQAPSKIGYSLLISLDYSIATSYRIQLIATLAGAPSSSFTDVEECDPPAGGTAGFTVTETGRTPEGLCTFDFIATNRKADTYSWTVDGVNYGASLDLIGIELDYSVPNTIYVARLQVTVRGHGTFEERNVTCTPVTTPNSNFSVENLGPGGDDGCEMTFSAIEQDADQYEWFLDDVPVNSNSEYNVTLLPKVDGAAYDVRLEVTVGLTSSSTTKEVACPETPTVPQGGFSSFSIISASEVDGVYTIRFSADHAGDQAGDRFRWEVDGAYRAQSQEPNLTLDFNAASTYEVKLINTYDGVEYTTTQDITAAIADTYI